MNQNNIPPAPRPDPLIDEVRALREAVSAEGGHDVRKLCERLQQLEQQYAARLVRPAVAAEPTRRVHGR